MHSAAGGNRRGKSLGSASKEKPDSLVCVKKKAPDALKERIIFDYAAAEGVVRRDENRKLHRRKKNHPSLACVRRDSASNWREGKKAYRIAAGHRGGVKGAQIKKKRHAGQSLHEGWRNFSSETNEGKGNGRFFAQ